MIEKYQKARNILKQFTQSSKPFTYQEICAQFNNTDNKIFVSPGVSIEDYLWYYVRIGKLKFNAVNKTYQNTKYVKE